MTLPLWAEPELPSAPRRLSLTSLASEIARSLAPIGRVAVEGEVYRPTTSRGGAVFFTLKDRVCQVAVSVKPGAVRRCRAVHGERAVVVGALKWANDRGQLLLDAEEVTPVGQGAVAAMIAEARARLDADGLVDRPRRAIPALPRAIGVLCGADAAVRRDIESVVTARFPGYPLVVLETTVSGPGAAFSITEALARLARAPEVEVIVLARGGGDATALLPWSDEDLCRAVAACRVPVVSAIGHEADRPLCDEVADLRCGTPSIAAHRVVPDRAALSERASAYLATALRDLAARRGRATDRLARAEVKGALASGSARARERLERAGPALAWAWPAPAAAQARRRLVACDWTLPIANRAADCGRRLASVAARAEALSPQHVVARGFAVVRHPDGSVVRAPSEVSPGQALDVTVARGSFQVVAT